MMVVELLESGKSPKEVSEDLGVKIDYVRRWREYKVEFYSRYLYVIL